MQRNEGSEVHDIIVGFSFYVASLLVGISKWAT